jgi:hypothetical protein
MTWFWSARHALASQWAMGGGAIKEPKEILGHFTV